MRRIDLLIFAGAIVVATGLYVWKGRPLLAEQAYSTREAEIAARDPTTLSPPEFLALLQKAAREKPDDPEAQYFIGLVMKSEARDDDAVRAFQSALRRDDTHVPSLVALADAAVRQSGGDISERTARIYERAWRLDPQQVRAGFFSVMPQLRAGDRATAEARWDEIEARLDPEDPQLGMLEAFKQAFKDEGDVVEGEVAPPQ